MALRIRFQYATGSQLGYSIERLADGTFYDFSVGTFVATPAAQIAKLPEDAGIYVGRYKVTLSPTPTAQFTDGDYAITAHDQGTSNAVVAELAATMHSGDDATVIPASGGGATVDPWSVALPGSYATGTAGAILGQNLDARVSTRSTYAGGPVASVTAPVTVGTNSDKAGYALATAPPTAAQIATATATAILATPGHPLATDATGAVLLPAAPAGYGGGGTAVPTGPDGHVLVSTGTLPGQVNLSGGNLAGPVPSVAGAVGAVTAPVTVGTNTDKAGYALAPSGFDAIQIEGGVNARQALVPILAASAGVVGGAGTGVIIIKGGNSSTTRITATTDNAGNRSAVTLTLPS